MKTFADKYTLLNGMTIPGMGFGTYNSKGGDSVEMVRTAIRAGYRYFDTASLYETERALGQAVKESGIPREDFFLVSKVWIDEMGYEETRVALHRTLERLQTDYLDLYLIHWPRRIEGDTDWKQIDLDTWRAMEEMKKEGLIRGLGLSNFLPHHLDNILENGTEKPLVDQLEIHPGYSQEAAVSYCKSKGIVVQAWSPLGRSRILENEFFQALAKKYNKSAAQICLRFLIQKDIIPLVKSANFERMKENQNIFDFEISREDMQMLECMPQDTWLGEHPDFHIPKKTCNLNQ